MQSKHILTEVVQKYGEWLEMEDDRVSLIVSILCQMVERERIENRYLKGKINERSNSR